MKKLIYIILPFLFVSCTTVSNRKNITYDTFANMINDCEGTTIVIGTEDNLGNFDSKRHGVFVRDSIGTIREWYGGHTNFNVGDTIK